MAMPAAGQVMQNHSNQMKIADSSVFLVLPVCKGVGTRWRNEVSIVSSQYIPGQLVIVTSPTAFEACGVCRQQQQTISGMSRVEIAPQTLLQEALGSLRSNQIMALALFMVQALHGDVCASLAVTVPV
eukprot:18496-Amphidinium_carterae.1